MLFGDQLLITGGGGLLGTALRKCLSESGYTAVSAPSSHEVDLTESSSALRLFKEVKPKYVFHLAGAVFGLGGNLKDPAHTFLKNTLINTNVVEACRQAGVKKILGMGSICAYPSELGSKQVLREENLFDGIPHPGELAYGQSKRSLLVHMEACHKASGLDYAFALSTNLYGPYDRFNIENGHVIPSLIHKFHRAKQERVTVDVWGDGSSKRDFMFSEDAARALLAIMKSHRGRVNLATGEMTSIREVVDILARHTGTEDLVKFNPDKPKGHEFLGLDVSKLKELGFKPASTLKQALHTTFDWYSENYERARH